MTSRTGRNVIAVVASAGGVAALRDLLSRLPEELPATVLALIHISAEGGGALSRVLQRGCPLPVDYARDGERVQPGCVRLAVPNRHLLLDGDLLHLSSGPRQNGYRPAADSLLFSLALAAGPDATAVVLSGALDDGAAGCVAVRRCGGRVLVQDPEQAMFPGMPNAALLAVPDAIRLPVEDLAAEIVHHAFARSREGAPERPEPEPWLERRVALLLRDGAPTDPEDAGESLSCPECDGPIRSATTGWGEQPRFECLVGHAWTERAMLTGQTGRVEWALEVAARHLEERGRLTRRLGEAAADRGHTRTAEQFAEAGEQAERAMRTLRELIAQLGVTAGADLLGDELPDGRASTT